MSRTNRNSPKGGRGSGRRERHISVRGVRRDPPDLRKLSRAVIALAMAEAEAQAQQTSTADTDDTFVKTSPGDTDSEADHERT